MSDSLNTIQAKIIIEELVRLGVTRFCISPGSRSTPLVVAAARHPKAQIQIGYDERGTAYFALGYARATGRPAAVITTSGTAVANLMPAVTEASVGRVPMLLLTADRPPELSDIGANQTLIQPGIFTPYVRWQFDLPCPDDKFHAAAVLSTIDHAVERTLGAAPGPVHLNLRFREPLEPAASTLETAYLAPLGDWPDRNTPHCQPSVTTGGSGSGPAVSDALLDDVAQLAVDTEQGMLVIGSLAASAEQQAAARVAEQLGWAVYADLTSGLRLGKLGTNLIRHYDPLEVDNGFYDRAAPSVMLHLGGAVISKRMGQFIQARPPQHLLIVKPHPDRYDPVALATRSIQADIADFCNRLADRIPHRRPGPIARFHQQKALAAQQIIEQAVTQDANLTEAFVARRLSQTMAEDDALFVSSSMPIRDVDLYSDVAGPRLTVACNRGVSGIDGVMATTSGFAAGRQKPVTLLIGDIAMLHDLNSLELAARSANPITVVIINNQGGGIFDFLPISAVSDVFEPLFITPHAYRFEGVCSMYGLGYHQADTKEAFETGLAGLRATGRSGVIEVITDRKINFELRKRMKRAILRSILD